MSAAYDNYLPWFDKPLPALLKAWDSMPDRDQTKNKLAEQIAILRRWDQRWAVDSVPTSLAVFWGEEIRALCQSDAKKAGLSVEEYATAKLAPERLVLALVTASKRLQTDFGTWKTPWGEINRYQRLTADIVQKYDDAKPSLPVGFTSSFWGSLASFSARPYPGTKKWYGTSGNSFVAVVEFGDKVRAKAVTAGGESGDPNSRHFNDEALRYSTGNLRDVYFYRDDLKAHAERKYHPGS